MKKSLMLCLAFLGSYCTMAQLFNHSKVSSRLPSEVNKKQNEYFLHGVASGDPTQNSVIIWTRVSNESSEELEVNYKIATKPDMLAIVAEGITTTSAERDYTVKVDVVDLEPGTTYYYEFNYNEETSIKGRTRTASLDDEHLRFGVVSCSDYQAGYFNTYGLLAKQADLDAIIHLGDYIYEYGKRSNGWDSLLMRAFGPEHEILSLIDYRTRYSFYRLDKDLQVVHQQHPFISVWDDHETANDSYVEGAQNHDEATEGSWEERKAAGKKAWFEWMPVRETDNQKIYRSVDYGNLVNLTMLDTRLEGRMPQIELANDSALIDPNRTLLGKEQLNWFKNELLSNTATWHIIGNQVIFGHVEVGPLAIIPQAATFFYDTWVGYPTERDTIIHFINDNNLDNIVITTGDFHITLAVDIAVNPFDSLTYKPNTGAGSVCVELAVPSVSSANFDENADIVSGLSPEGFVAAVESSIPPANPHLKKLELVSHGYALLDITTEKAQVDYFYTDTLYIPSTNEIYGSSLMTMSGNNHWQAVDQPSEPKAESPDLVGDLTSVDEYNINHTLHMLGSYPNPADDFSMLNLQVNDVTQIEMHLLDVNGKLVQQLANEKVVPGFYSINLNTKSLSNGMYMIRVKAGNSIRNQKLMVQH